VRQSQHMPQLVSHHLIQNNLPTHLSTRSRLRQPHPHRQNDRPIRLRPHLRPPHQSRHSTGRRPSLGRPGRDDDLRLLFTISAPEHSNAQHLHRQRIPIVDRPPRGCIESGITKRGRMQRQRKSSFRMKLPPRERGLRSERDRRPSRDNRRRQDQRREKAPAARRRRKARLRRGPATSQGGMTEPTKQLGPYRGADRGVGLALAQTMTISTPSP
jgi:hypothetical protein